MSAVVVACDAEAWIEACLRAVRKNHPAEVILVDRGSSDRTVERARALVDRVIVERGASAAMSRMIGADAAARPWVAFVDADVVMPAGALRDMTVERMSRRVQALHAGLEGSAPGEYPCVILIRRDLAINRPLDGELAAARHLRNRPGPAPAPVPLSASRSTVVEHRGLYQGFRRRAHLAGYGLAAAVGAALLGRLAYDGSAAAEAVAVATLLLAGAVEVAKSAVRPRLAAAIPRLAPLALGAMALGVALSALRLAGVLAG